MFIPMVGVAARYSSPVEQRAAADVPSKAPHLGYGYLEPIALHHDDRIGLKIVNTSIQ
jgi:hypothetical protein